MLITLPVHIGSLLTSSILATFHSTIPTNHHGYFVDLDLAGQFDHRLPSILSPPSQILDATDPLQVVTYVETLFQSVTKHNIFSRIKKLEKSFSLTIYETLDNQITELMLSAVQKYHRPRKYSVPPSIYVILLKTYMLKISISALRNKYNFTPKIATLRAKLPPTDTFVLPSSLTDSYRLLPSCVNNFAITVKFLKLALKPENKTEKKLLSKPIQI